MTRSMKNQYFGDINDFLKYGLLRCFADAGLRIGVCWMLTADDARPDGGKISYLFDPKRWRNSDPPLFDSLSAAITQNLRRVRHFQNSHLLPNASFYDPLVPDSQPSRKRWLTKCLRKLKDVDLLFFDPDNGIEIKSKPTGKKGSSKYLFWDEVEVAWAQGSSLVIFQHFSREKRDQHVSRLASRLAKLSGEAIVVPLITSNVVYLLAVQSRHAKTIGKALRTMDTRWAGQIRRFSSQHLVAKAPGV